MSQDLPRRSGQEEPAAPNRPKRRTDADPQITSWQRRQHLGSSFAQRQSLGQAQEYDAVRPRYPEAAVQDILALAAADSHSPAPIQVVDLGAGTGILTRQLLAAGAAVHAVEPSIPMTEVLAYSPLPRLQITHAPAERTGLPAACAQIVVAAQAWHWFEPHTVQAEVARLLVPGGALALIWNYLDTSDEVVHRLTRIMRAGDVYRPDWRPALDPEIFGQRRSTEYRWARSLTVEEIFRYATTLSSWLSAEDHERARRRANLEDYLFGELGLSATDSLHLPQITALHTAVLRGRP
ncbi:class I SAM-dependent methyltransferase [Nesterenkonia sp.]|uniref:class I SAM-dependent methyltransferase n=1 Tax=Nesterenkonia sp. TaxID=704201 RepID=UPI002602839B|nr:class I SAM-dependent methyltransferase [Nesterenkonia sp.]